MSIVRSEVRCVLQVRALVGESPRWDERAQLLWWVDIYEPSLNRFDPRTGENRKFAMPERIGCFSLRERGGFIAGMQSGIAFIGPDASTVERVFELAPDDPQTRFNDGRCDPAGRFWAGSLHESLAQRAGALYCFDPDGSCRKMIDHMIVPNGMAWGADGRTLYHSDSRQDYVWAWDWDAATGAIANQRVFLACDALEGRLDGAAMDADGGYWSCKVGAWHVARYTPDGQIDTVIGVPVQRPTACAFGGPDLDTLYITSARLPLSETALAKQPLAGSLFAVKLGVKGLVEHRFAG